MPCKSKETLGNSPAAPVNPQLSAARPVVNYRANVYLSNEAHFAIIIFAMDGEIASSMSISQRTLDAADHRICRRITAPKLRAGLDNFRVACFNEDIMNRRGTRRARVPDTFRGETRFLSGGPPPRRYRPAAPILFHNPATPNTRLTGSLPRSLSIRQVPIKSR